MSKLVIRSDGSNTCIHAPLFGPAAIYRIGAGFAEQCMSTLYKIFGGKQRVEQGRYLIRWSNARFTLEVTMSEKQEALVSQRSAQDIDRFAVPVHGEREAEVVAVCACCGEQLREGDEGVLFVDLAEDKDEYFCDEACLVQYLERVGVLRHVTLHSGSREEVKEHV